MLQQQDSIKNFSQKISAGKKAKATEEFMIIARIESLILGKNGDNITKYRSELAKEFNKPINITVIPEKEPEKSSRLLAESICVQLEKRIRSKRNALFQARTQAQNKFTVEN